MPTGILWSALRKGIQMLCSASGIHKSLKPGETQGNGHVGCGLWCVADTITRNPATSRGKFGCLCAFAWMKIKYWS